MLGALSLEVWQTSHHEYMGKTLQQTLEPALEGQLTHSLELALQWLLAQKKAPPGLTAAERAARDLRARRRFKAIARLIMANLFWMSDFEDTMGENVVLNIQRLTRKKVTKSTLTTKEKMILNKPTEQRTEEDKHVLDRAIGGLKVFRRYPPTVKSDLAAITYFVFIDADRVIVKQDHPPSAMYFLLAGECKVTVKTYDKMLKEWLEDEHGTVGPGTMFGEVALIHGIARTATITTTVPCELLMIKKEDFDIVLKETVWKSWEHTAKIMNRFSYFKHWDAMAKRECSIISRTKSFEPQDIILGDGCGLPNYSYLVTKGTCIMIENLQIEVENINGVTKHRLYIPKKHETDERYLPSRCILKRKKKRVTTGSSKSKSKKKARVLKRMEYVLETHFMKVCEFSEGAIFNVGEKFERRRVVAETEVKCLLIPRYWLLKLNQDNLWSRVQQFLNTNVPSTEKLYAHYMKERKLYNYRQKLVKSLLQERRIPNTNSIHNVPYSIRLNSCCYWFMKEAYHFKQ